MSDLHYKRKEHRAWRAAVLNRAKLLCEECKRFGRRTPATIAHHIKPREEYPERQYDLANGRALCADCHNAAHPEKARAIRRRW